MARVLVVEDDAALQEAYSFLLNAQGHKVTSAYNGAEALSCIESATYDVILLDMHMPVMNGLVFLEKFQKKRPADTTIIFFSNMIEPKIQKQALTLGADKCILKSSMTPKKMLQLIEKAQNKKTA